MLLLLTLVQKQMNMDKSSIQRLNLRCQETQTRHSTKAFVQSYDWCTVRCIPEATGPDVQ